MHRERHRQLEPVAGTDPSNWDDSSDTHIVGSAAQISMNAGSTVQLKVAETARVGRAEAELTDRTGLLLGQTAIATSG